MRHGAIMPSVVAELAAEGKALDSLYHIELEVRGKLQLRTNGPSRTYHIGVAHREQLVLGRRVL